MRARPPDIAGDPRVLRSAWRVRFFREAMRRQVRGAFHAVRVARPGPPALPADRALVVYCNHPSWWDAAVLPLVFERFFPVRPIYAPMDAEALARYGFMRRVGLFGIERGAHAGGAAFLRVGAALLEQPDTLLCLTPQGRFADPRERPVRLRPGLVGLLQRAPAVTLLPVALDYPFWTERTPEALVRFGAPLLLGAGDTLAPAALGERLEAQLTQTMDALAADALARDPARFESLLDGRVGVGGVYDAWRRLQAWRRGERFDPAHLPQARTPTVPLPTQPLPSRPGDHR